MSCKWGNADALTRASHSTFLHPSILTVNSPFLILYILSNFSPFLVLFPLVCDVEGAHKRHVDHQSRILTYILSQKLILVNILLKILLQRAEEPGVASGPSRKEEDALLVGSESRQVEGVLLSEQRRGTDDRGIYPSSHLGTLMAPCTIALGHPNRASEKEGDQTELLNTARSPNRYTDLSLENNLLHYSGPSAHLSQPAKSEPH